MITAGVFAPFASIHHLSVIMQAVYAAVGIRRTHPTPHRGGGTLGW
jgi:hypothetical protein